MVIFRKTNLIGVYLSGKIIYEKNIVLVS